MTTKFSIDIESIKAHLVIEGAKDLGDAEIERCFNGCVAGFQIIPIVKELVKNGFLKYSGISKRMEN